MEKSLYSSCLLFFTTVHKQTASARCVYQTRDPNEWEVDVCTFLMDEINQEGLF